MFEAAVGAVGSGGSPLSWAVKSAMIGAICSSAGSLFSAAALALQSDYFSRAAGSGPSACEAYFDGGIEVGGKNSRQYDLNVPTRRYHRDSGRLSDRYRVQLQRRMALDARRDIIIPAILLLIGVFFLPDSPRWLRRNAVSMMLNASCCACVTQLPEAKRESSMKFAKVCRLNRAVGRCSKKLTASAAPCFLAHFVAGHAAICRMNVIMYYAPIFELWRGYTNTTGRCGAPLLLV